MKIYLNRKPVPGPWGGGSKFLLSLEKGLTALGFEVTYEWSDISTIDLIYCHDPRPNDEGIWYQHYLAAKSQYGIPILQRVGDAGSHGKKDLTELVRASSSHSDFVVFPSMWSKEYIGFAKDNYSIIHNSPLENFYNYRLPHTNSPSPTRLVTHHWSNNEKKGFNVYRELAAFCHLNSESYHFSYIGRFQHPLPNSGMAYFEPMNASELSIELPRHDIYITASLEEAGANHVLEAMAAGLPVLFHEGGGSINEYCGNYGLSYSCFNSLINNLNEMVSRYDEYSRMVQGYRRTPHDMTAEYINIIHGIIGENE